MDNHTKPPITFFHCTQRRTLVQQGVTLIELIVAISIMAIIIAMGTPSFHAMIVSNRLTSQANTLVGALSFARSEAIKRNKPVVLAPLVVGANWQDGWHIFVDINSDNIFDVDEPDVQRYEAISSGFVIHRVGFSNADRVVYRPDGRTTTFGHFDLCSPASDVDFREIVISDTGRVRVDRPASPSQAAYNAAGC